MIFPLLLILMAHRVVPASAASPSKFIKTCDSASFDKECIIHALIEDGAVVISGVPGLARSRAEGLCEVGRCSGEPDSEARHVLLSDGTSRSTFGARTALGVPLKLSAPSCPNLAEATDALRAIVDQTARKFLGTLEPLVRRPAMLRAGSDQYDTLAEIARHGDQLEHFHTYAAGNRTIASSSASRFSFARHMSVNSEQAPDAVPLHTDAGLFIAIVPALHLDAQPGDGAGCADGSFRAPTSANDGFYVERGDGVRVRVNPEVEDNSLVFVLGDGWVQWLGPQMSVQMRAAPHGMVMPSAPESLRRVWYGRMFLPPLEAIVSPDGTTFGEWKRSHEAGAAKSSGSASPNDSIAVGCSSHGRLLQHQDPHSCAANELYCWLQCMASPCGKSAQCIDSRTGMPWDTVSHCTSCQPVCSPPASPPPSHHAPHPIDAPTSPPPPPPESKFCYGPGTAMHMAGFAASGEADCVILLFEPWKLDTKTTFALGVIGTFLLGLLTEGLTWLRREKVQPHLSLTRRPIVLKLVMGFLYLIQVTFGYFLMLIAMTYQAELFIAVVVGLAAGHTAFNISAPVSESVDACCVESTHTRKAPVGREHEQTMQSSSSEPRGDIFLRVSSITCPDCCDKVTAALQEVNGVNAAKVSLDGTAKVEAEGPVVVASLLNAVESVGKTAELHDSTNQRVRNGVLLVE